MNNIIHTTYNNGQLYLCTLYIHVMTISLISSFVDSVQLWQGFLHHMRSLSFCPTRQEPSLQVADHVHQERRQMKEQLDRTVAEKCQLEDIIEHLKVTAKKWKMQLDETTVKLIQKEDEVNDLKKQLKIPIN